MDGTEPEEPNRLAHQALLDELLQSEAPSLMRSLGIRLLSASGERVVATMPVTPGHHQPHGILHGGASVALAESVASIGASLALQGAGQRAVGLEINANHLRAVSTGSVTATAVPVHRGRSTHVWSVEIVDEAERLVCVSRCTLAVLEGAPAARRHTKQGRASQEG